MDIIAHSGHHAEVALFSDGPFREALVQMGVPVHLVPLGVTADVRRDSSLPHLVSAIPSIIRARGVMRSLAERFDLIYANSQKAFLVSALSRKKKQPVVWHLRDMLTGEHFSYPVRRTAVAFGNVAATAVVANSHATLHSFIAAGGHRSRATVVYNGIDAAPFDSVSAEDIREVRSGLGLPVEFVVGVFGRLHPWKGQHIAIEAIARVPNCHLIIVGDALFGEFQYLNMLRDQTSKLKIEDRVHFLGFRRDIPLLMRAVNVVIHTSISPEPFGRVVVEGMLSGKPVIASGAGGVTEIIEHERDGILVQPGSVDELVASINKIKQDPSFAESLSRRGNAKAKHSFSRDAMIIGIRKVLDSVQGCIGAS